MEQYIQRWNNTVVHRRMLSTPRAKGPPRAIEYGITQSGTPRKRLLAARYLSASSEHCVERSDLDVDSVQGCGDGGGLSHEEEEHTELQEEWPKQLGPTPTSAFGQSAGDSMHRLSPEQGEPSSEDGPTQGCIVEAPLQPPQTMRHVRRKYKQMVLAFSRKRSRANAVGFQRAGEVGGARMSKRRRSDLARLPSESFITRGSATHPVLDKSLSILRCFQRIHFRHEYGANLRTVLRGCAERGRPLSRARDMLRAAQEMLPQAEAAVASEARTWFNCLSGRFAVLDRFNMLGSQGWRGWVSLARCPSPSPSSLWSRARPHCTTLPGWILPRQGPRPLPRPPVPVALRHWNT